MKSKIPTDLKANNSVVKFKDITSMIVFVLYQ